MVRVRRRLNTRLRSLPRIAFFADLVIAILLV
jgi:hypothetical protein